MYPLLYKSISSTSSSSITMSLLALLLVAIFGSIESHQHQQQYYGASIAASAPPSVMPTVTVRGFLNFRTTVDGTVIVFTPSPSNGQQAPPTSSSSSSIVMTDRPMIPPAAQSQSIKPTKLQNEIRPTKSSSIAATYPTGLVTVLGGTVVNDGSTTVYETKVIGTYIDGKYAQILSSTTRMPAAAMMVSPTIRPTNTYHHHNVRPTRMVPQQQPQQHQNDPAPTTAHDNHQSSDDETNQSNSIYAAKKMHPLRAKSFKLMETAKTRHLNARLQLNPLKSRWAKLKDNDGDSGATNGSESNQENSSTKIRRRSKILAPAKSRFQLPSRPGSPRVKMNRFKTSLSGSSGSKLPATQAEEMQNYYQNKQLEEQQAQQARNESSTIDAETKEKILENLSSGNSHNDSDQSQDQPSADDNESKIDPTKVVKEVQTITSEVTQHVDGNHLQVKTLTLTKTIERTLHPTESEFNTHMIQPTIDIGGNNIEATSIPETPSLVISRTYSVTERTMRTTVVPVFDGTQTQSHTVTESFFIRKLITAYRTLPPGDMILIDSTSTIDSDGDHMIQATAVSSLNNGTSSDFIDDDLSMAEQQTIQPTSVNSNILATEMPSMLDDNFLQSINGNPNPNNDNQQPALIDTTSPYEPTNNMLMGQMMMPSFIPSSPSTVPSQNQLAQQFDLNNPLLLAAVIQNPQLAALYIGLQQQQQQQQLKSTIALQPSMNQQPQQYQTITKPTKMMQTETLYSTKLISYYDGRQTRSRTVLEPTSTIEKLVNTYTTEVVAIPLAAAAPSSPQQGLLQNMLLMKQLQQQQQQQAQRFQHQLTPTLQTSTLLKTITTVTDTTMTKSKVYTLVYNAFSTRYRTITSTSVMPTTVTIILTEMIPVLPTSISFFG